MKKKVKDIRHTILLNVLIYTVLAEFDILDDSVYNMPELYSKILGRNASLLFSFSSRILSYSFIHESSLLHNCNNATTFQKILNEQIFIPLITCALCTCLPKSLTELLLHLLKT